MILDTNIMEFAHMIQFSLISKIMTEASGPILANKYLCAICIVAFLLSKMPNKIKNAISDSIINYLYDPNNADESCILITSHKKTYYTSTMGVAKETARMDYSDYFHGLNHFLLTKIPDKISCLCENIKKENERYYTDSENEYGFMPHYNVKIQIVENPPIFFENIIQNKNRDDDDDENKNKITTGEHKHYTYKLTTPGRNNVKSLTKFIESCHDAYIKFNEPINQQIYEYAKSKKDDCDKIKMVYYSKPFKSNKTFDHIFYDQKEDLLEYIRRFSNPANILKNEQEYNNSGITCKTTLLLYGPPGCGKSSTIRAALNETGRHGVLIRWSTIKTCRDFCNIFRPEMINKKYTLVDVCYIFEDFDANSSNILKRRPKIENNNIVNYMTASDDDDNDFNEFINGQNDNEKYKALITKQHEKIKKLSSIVGTISRPMDDELTMECVLNVLDGVAELHQAMIIFSTNCPIEDIDPAFLRTGRIDKKVKLTYASTNTIKQMIQHKFQLSEEDMMLYKDQMANILPGKISPADIQSICFSYNREQVKECINKINSFQ